MIQSIKTTKPDENEVAKHQKRKTSQMAPAVSV